jgi:response regulator RpfG family c-di-GMP phosphodiesterase
MSFGDLTAVVVDDSEDSLFLIEEVTKMLGFQVRSFQCPLKALHFVRDNMVDMVFTDFRMPKMDGLAFIRETRKVHRDIPIAMITGELNASELKALLPEGVASEFFSKPFKTEDFFDRVKPLAQLRQFKKFSSMYRLKDDGFGNHQLRVGHYSKIIAAGLNWDKNEQDLLYDAAQLHDIGLISIPDRILSKTEGLTADEMQLVRKHPVIGHSMLQETSNPYFRMAATVSLTHHERFSGSGYPLGLSGIDIPVAGRITALADFFDVLTSARPDKIAWSFNKALCFISDNTDMHFDPEIVNIFVESADRIREVHNSLAG